MTEEENNEEKNSEPMDVSGKEVNRTGGSEAPKNVLLASLFHIFRVFFIVMAVYVLTLMIWRGYQGAGDGGIAKVLAGLLRGALEGMGCGYFIACIIGLALGSGYKTFPVAEGKYQIKWYNIVLGILGLVWFLFLTFILLGALL